jgi:ribosomal protein S18 acetylase RimI-like enzyme
MPDLKYLPISYLEDALLFPLMEEEEQAWMSDLGWDYSPIRQILISLAKQKLLPGYVALNEKGPVGYTYFLVNQSKGIIGALYASRMSHSQEAVEELLSLTIARLKELQNIQRIEAQIMPFHDVNLTATFTQHGFCFFPRYYLDLDLSTQPKKTELTSAEQITPWKPAFLERAAEMTAISYRNQTDAEICEDYRTQMGCEIYLRSLVENPGCGIFMPEASFMVFDGQGSVCGFVICCRISRGAGMIPQIAVHPSYQGRGLGNALIHHALEKLKAMGFHSVSLTVTKKNRRAFDWYQRLGFRIRKEFGAYVWERQHSVE